MTIQNTLILFNRLLSESTKKSEVRIYKEYIKLLSNLEKRELSETEIKTIEIELEQLVLSAKTKNKSKHLRKELNRFKTFLRTNLSLISEGYYTNSSTAIGMNLGLLAGIVLLSNFERSLGISIGISVGALFGFAIGKHLESEAKTKGNLI